MSDKNTGLPNSVIAWLQSNINNIYKTPDRRILFNDILWCLTKFKSILRPRTRVFVEPKGNSKLLLCLYGTFSIANPSSSMYISPNVFNNEHNQMILQNKISEIPILIWILDNYPHTIPLIYIDLDKLRDTTSNVSKFMINLSKNIDSNGQIYLPNFESWNHNDPNCNIINIVKDLQILINNKILLYKLPEQRINQENTTNNNDLSAPPPIPKRIQADDVTHSMSSISLNTEDANTIGTKPFQTVQPPIQHLNDKLTNGNNDNSKENSLPPPIPQRPILNSTTKSQSQIQSNSYNTPRSATHLTESKQTESSDTKIDSQNVQLAQPDFIDLMNDDSYIHSINPSQQIAISKLLSQLQALDNMTQDNIQNTKKSELMKIKTCIQQFDQLLEHEKKQLDEINKNINSQSKSIDMEMDKLNELQNGWSRNFKKIDDIKLDSLENIQITETLGLNQCYRLAARDKSIADTLLLLNDSLNNQKVPLDSFVRKSRQLAREQFTVKFHLEKNFKLLDNTN